MNEPVSDTSIAENKGANMYFHSYSINDTFKLSPTEIGQYQLLVRLENKSWYKEGIILL